MAAERVLLDTSLLVAASVEEHPRHAASETYVEGLGSFLRTSRTSDRLLHGRWIPQSGIDPRWRCACERAPGVYSEAMSLSSEYKRQFAWRDWSTALGALPSVRGQLVLDLGCGVGDQAAELVARGAHVIGIDINEELLREAWSRSLENAEFRLHDLRALPELGVLADGMWCSFAAAYFPDLPGTLESWATHLRPGGWIGLTEVDDLFGHEPLGTEAKSIFAAYAQDALVQRRYDFHMGRKLRPFLEQCGFIVSKELTLQDQELSFTGPARPDVIDAWRARLDRMKPLQDFAGVGFERLREEFLQCMTRPEHRSTAKVYCCVAARPAQAA